MAAIADLLRQIDNPELQDRIRTGVYRMNKQKKLGLVFKEHLSECTTSFDISVQKGSVVEHKSGKISENYVVLQTVRDDVPPLEH